MSARLKKQTKVIKKNAKKPKAAKETTKKTKPLSPLAQLLLQDADRTCVQCNKGFFGRGNLCCYNCASAFFSAQRKLRKTN